MTYLHLGTRRGGGHRALRAAATAAAIYEHDEDHLDVLAGAVFTVACAYADIGDLPNAVKKAEEAVALNERGHAGDPDRFADGLDEARALLDELLRLRDRLSPHDSDVEMREPRISLIM